MNFLMYKEGLRFILNDSGGVQSSCTGLDYSA